MECRKNFVHCLNRLIESKVRIQKSWLHLKTVKPELHKEIIQIAQKEELKLAWKGTDIDLIELVTALYDSGIVSSNRVRLEKKEFLAAFELLFNIQIKNSATKLCRARNRKKDAAPLLEMLKQVFIRGSDSVEIFKN